MVAPGEINPTDEQLPRNTPKELTLEVLAIMLAAKEGFQDDSATYEADLHLFGGQSEDQAYVNIAYIQELGRYHELRHSTSYPTDSVFRPETMDMQKRSLAVGRTLLSFSNQVAKELASTEIYDLSRANTTDKLLLQNRDPFEVMLQWNAVADLIINQAADILATTAKRFKDYLPPPESAIVETEMQEAPKLQNTTRTIPGLDAIIELIHDPKSTTNRTVLPIIAKNLTELYEDWQETARLNRGVTRKVLGTIAMLGIPEVQNALQRGIKVLEDAQEIRPEAQVQPLQDELAEHLAVIIEASKAFCPTWTSLKAKLKPFANEMLRLSRKEKHPLPIPEDANKRLTGILYVLEQLGSVTANPAESYTKLKMLFIGEYREKQIIDAYVRALAAGNAKPNVGVDTWRPAAEDIVSLDEQWDRIEPIIREHWTPQKGTREDAITAMRKAIDQYYAARLNARRELTRDEISSIVRSQGMSENYQRRAAVLDHFIRLSDSQRHDASKPDAVRWSDTSTQEQSYFCVTFKDSTDREWAMLETLTGEKNTFAIPLDIIAMYGALDEFLDMFDADMQDEFAEYQIAHEDGWTTESHIARITAKVTE